MGLDINFDKQKALAAGMVMERVRNGDDVVIQNSIDNGDSDDYIAWLKEYSLLAKFPWSSGMWHDIGEGDTCGVRANKWGNIYKPLTLWLRQNNIECYEA